MTAKSEQGNVDPALELWCQLADHLRGNWQVDHIGTVRKLIANALQRTAQRQRDQDIAIIQRNIHRMKSGQLIVGVKAELYAEQLRNAPLVTDSSP